MIAPRLLSAPSTSLPSSMQPGISRGLNTAIAAGRRRWMSSVRSRGGVGSSVASSSAARYIKSTDARSRLFPSSILSSARYQSTSSNSPDPSAPQPVVVTPSTTVPIPPPADAAAASPPTSRVKESLITTTLIVLFFSAGLIMSAAPAADTVNGFLNPPSDAETLTMFQPATPETASINDHITTHPLAVKLRAQAGVVESRPHLKIPEAMRPHNLTGGVLLGAGKIEVPPLSLAEASAELPRLTQIAYLGPSLCGHPGIVHGGLLATLLDEGLARACFPALPNKVGVTASLKIDYRAPCPAGTYVVLKAETTKVEGRKAWVKGWIEQLTEDGEAGTKLVEAEALFIEPKGAASMARIYSGA